MITEKEDQILKSVLLYVDSLKDIQKAPFKPPSIPIYITDKLYDILQEEDDWKHDKITTRKRLLQLNRLEMQRKNTSPVKKRTAPKNEKIVGVDLLKWMDEQSDDEEEQIPHFSSKKNSENGVDSNQVKESALCRKLVFPARKDSPTILREQLTPTKGKYLGPNRVETKSALAKPNLFKDNLLEKLPINFIGKPRSTPRKDKPVAITRKEDQSEMVTPQRRSSRIRYKIKEFSSVNKSPKRIPDLAAESPVSVKKPKFTL